MRTYSGCWNPSPSARPCEPGASIPRGSSRFFIGGEVVKRILIVGSGGREHALAVAMLRDPEVQVHAAPGNAGMAEIATLHPLADASPEAILALARVQAVDLVVVGPEGPLVAGVADMLRSEGIACFGPGQAGARLEGSKAYAKDFLRRHRIPTADFRIFESHAHARGHARQTTGRCVIKADGLAAGKGVFVCSGAAEAESAVRKLMVERSLGEAGERVVIEDCLEGEEASLFLLLNGSSAMAFPLAQDFKRLRDGDEGPNTGGMGSIVPHPHGTPAVWKRLDRLIIHPLLEGLQREGIEYRGLLYVGLMLTEAGPMVLEFNCRFGDPETQPLTMLCDGPWLPMLDAAARGLELPDMEPGQGVAVARVIAGENYPGPGGKEVPLEGLDAAGRVEGVRIFHSGTRLRAGEVMGGPGRMISVCALRANLVEALSAVEDATGRLNIPGAQYRSDFLERVVDAERPAPRPKLWKRPEAEAAAAAPARARPGFQRDRPETRGPAPRALRAGKGFDRPVRPEGPRPGGFRDRSTRASEGRPFPRRREAGVVPREGAPRAPRGAGYRPESASGRPRTGPPSRRPPAPGGDRPFRRPTRPEGDRPARPARAGSDRPYRPSAPEGKRPFRPAAPGGDRPFRRTERSPGDRPYPARRPDSARPAQGRPAGPSEHRGRERPASPPRRGEAAGSRVPGSRPEGPFRGKPTRPEGGRAFPARRTDSARPERRPSGPPGADRRGSPAGTSRPPRREGRPEPKGFQRSGASRPTQGRPARGPGAGPVRGPRGPRKPGAK